MFRENPVSSGDVISGKTRLALRASESFLSTKLLLNMSVMASEV